MKKFKLLTILFLAVVCALSLFAFSSCSDGKKYDGIKVTYNLSGGTYKNSEKDVIVYYKYPDGARRLIRALPIGDKDSATVIKLGNNLTGWSKDAEGNEMWDFENDVVDDEGVTLYAIWTPKVEYLYSIGYMDGENFVEVNSAIAQPSTSFDFGLDDIINAADTRDGYTLLYNNIECDKTDYDKYFDENGILKESETNVTIRVYAEYIEGNYHLLYSYDDLGTLGNSENKLKGKTLLLMNDIDCKGKTLSENFRTAFATDKNGTPNYLGIQSYDPEGKGVKHSISNFAIKCTYMDKITAPLTASIFADIGVSGEQNAETIVKITGVSFTDVIINADVGNDSISKLYVSSFADNIHNAEITNVSVSVKIIASKLRVNADNTSFFCEAEHVYARTTENVKTDGCAFVITETVSKKGEKIELTKENA